jgi:hypothetical protein
MEMDSDSGTQGVSAFWKIVLLPCSVGNTLLSNGAWATEVGRVGR